MNKAKVNFWLFLCLFLGSVRIDAQTLEVIKGLVADNNGKPMAGVLVKVKDSPQKVVTTDLSGNFEIEGKKNTALSFSFVGYYNQDITWRGQRKLIVQLSPCYFDDPVQTKIPVLGGEISRDEMVQSVGYVSNGQLSTYHGSQTLEALAGRMAGLRVTFNDGSISGLDNSGISFNLRGSRSQTILIDGVERGYTNIDPEQIESVTVLKDALSTVLFGNRSSDGIISINTKKGQKGAPRFSFTAERGFRKANALPDVLPAWQYATLYNEAVLNENPNARPAFTDEQIAAYKNQSNPYGLPDVKWYDQVLEKTAPTQRYNFNVSGSGRGFTYFADFDYMCQEGFFKTRSENNFNTNEELNRFIIRSNVGADITKTTHMQVNLFGRSLRYNEPNAGTSNIFSTLFNTPQNAYPVYNPNGSLGTSTLYGANANLWGKATYGGHKFTDVRDLAVDVLVDQKLDFLLNGLYLKVQGSYNNSTNYLTTRGMDFESYLYDPDNDSYRIYGQNSNQSTKGEAKDRYRVTYLKGEIGYDKNMGKHHIAAMLFADEQNTFTYSAKELPAIFRNYGGRLNYSYDNRILAEVAAVRSGHNWYAPAERWNNYWALGLSWNLHKEKFMKSLPWVSQLKPRISYGHTGLANPSYFGYIQTYTLENDNRFDWYKFNWVLCKGTFENNLVNQDLHPEQADKLNIGLDVGLWNDRLTVTGEYFFNRFYDLNKAPNYTTNILGAKYPNMNYQKFNYLGGEVSATWKDNVHNFNYYISANLSYVQSEVINIQELSRDHEWQIGTGRPVGIRYGYVADGLFRSQQEIDDCKAVLKEAPKSALRPGDIRYKDLNDDGVIDQHDWGVIGTDKPQGYYGINLGFNYRGIDFSALFQGTLNREVYMNGDYMNGFGSGGKNNAYAYNLGRFTEATAATATQPRLWIGSNTNNQLTSTFWLKNGDYLRLKNIELGYTLPTQWTRKIYLPSVRFFVSATNLLTFSELYDVREDLDPEAWGGTYPITKSVTFGVSVKL